MSVDTHYLQISGDRAKLASFSGSVSSRRLILKLELEIQTPEDYGYYLSVLENAQASQKRKGDKKAEKMKGESQ